MDFSEPLSRRIITPLLRSADKSTAGLLRPTIYPIKKQIPDR
jgi:hypothetical protein